MKIQSWRYSQLLALSIAMVILAVTTAHVSAAVTVTSFTSQAQTTQIVLKWTTASEVNNAGFNLYRSTSSTGPWTTKINTSIIPGCPGCPLGGNYSYTDNSAAKGQTYYYKLESVEFTGSTQQFGPVSAAISSPTATPTTPPTATRTPTMLATATATVVPSAATPTVYNSPTPPGTTPPTNTPFPTRIAFFGPQPTSGSPPANVRVSAPQPTAPLSAPDAAANVVENLKSQTSEDNSASTGISDSSADNNNNEPEAVPTFSTTNPLALGLITLSGLFAMSAIALGAASSYFFARRYIR